MESDAKTNWMRLIEAALIGLAFLVLIASANI